MKKHIDFGKNTLPAFGFGKEMDLDFEMNVTWISEWKEYVM